MTETQLFDVGGPVRTKPKKHRSEAYLARKRVKDRERKRNRVRALVGEGPIRVDSRTGRLYDVRYGIKLAYSWTCSECDQTWFASKAEYRKRDGVCTECRPAGRPAFPEGNDANRRSGLRVGQAQPANGNSSTASSWNNTSGRSLTDTETVHHIDGDRANNDPSNLQLRQGRHGKGQAHVCLDCGSHNITATHLQGGG